MEKNNKDWTSRIIFSPEDAIIFNSARLLLLFEVLKASKVKKGIDMERLSYYDFFAANPFLVVSKEDPEWLDLEIQGFDPNKLEYMSTAQRYRTKRESLKQYLSLLLLKGLIEVKNQDEKLLYQITPLGVEISNKLNSMYAISYRRSVSFIVKKLKDYSDKQLWDNARTWLEAKAFQVDLFDMVADNK